MGLLTKATNESAYLKAGFMGFPGSGKTFTASMLAIELAKEIGDKKPVAFFDTETGSDFVIQHFEKAGLDLLVAKRRSFVDLLTFMKEAEQIASVVIIDSISHVWTDLMEACKRRFKTARLEFHHWGPIKAEWNQFTEAYLNANVHAIICGRAGYEYEFQERDDDSGKKELIKTGTKMKAEGEFGYEPSLLVEMERVRDTALKIDIHRAHVLKDRWDRIDGRRFDDPKARDFWPAVEPLNIGGEHVGVRRGDDSADMFGDPDASRYEYQRQCEIEAEEIKNLFIKHNLDGQSGDAKRGRVLMLEKHFGTGAWTAITSLGLDKLQVGRQSLINELEPAPEGDDTVDFDADPEAKS